MLLLTTDLYINCNELIKEANILYSNVEYRNLYKDDLYYIQSMNRYINTYKNFKEIKINNI